jgi:glycine oxidase
LSETKKNPDIVIVGGGIIGVTLALELCARGAQVLLMERDALLAQSSQAAAGMLAPHDPHNPPALHSLSVYSAGLYPAFLERIASLSGIAIGFQTHATRQYVPLHYGSQAESYWLPEHSIDPRELAAALRLALAHSSIRVMEHASVPPPQGPVVVHTVGAWSPQATPVKGQMLRVRVPSGVALREVHRSEHIYIVPRLHGPQQGTALIGATVEHAGFDTSTHPKDLAELHAAACALLPQLHGATVVEAWAGLRPGTPDNLPLIGQVGPRAFLSTGHFRNGILLAPATAQVVADSIERKPPAVALSAFSPHRFHDRDPVDIDIRASMMTTDFRTFDNSERC